MENVFDELFGIEGVHGLFLVSVQGVPLFQKFRAPLEKLNNVNLENFFNKSFDIKGLIQQFEKAGESLLIYGQKRIYVLKAGKAYLFIVLDMFAPVAMVRLNCRLIIPEVEKMKFSKGLGRFFKK